MPPSYWFAAHTVYELVDADGVTFYVGCTADYHVRMASHRDRFGDRLVKIRRRGRFLDRLDARAKEARLIAELRPVENKVGNPPDYHERVKAARRAS